MYTLKVRYERSTRSESGPALSEVVDETVLFFPADRVVVNRCDDPGETVDAWEKSGTALLDWRSVVDVDEGTHGQRAPWANVKLVEVIHDEVSRWLLVTQAWLLGPHGGTIERIAP